MADSTHQQIASAVKDLIAEVGLPAGFVEGLAKGDDWSFVVKLHALIEAGVTHALVAHVAKDEAREIFANLELNNTKTGKIAFAGIFLDLESEDRRFMRALSELRNAIVHDVRNVSLDLNKHFADLSLEKKRSFMKAFGYIQLGDDETPHQIDGVIAEWGTDVRPLLLRSAMFLLAILQLQIYTVRAEQEAIGHKLKFAELLGAKRSVVREAIERAGASEGEAGSGKPQG